MFLIIYVFLRIYVHAFNCSLASYNKRRKGSVLYADIQNDLSSLEQHLVSCHTLFIVRDKRGSKVPVLIPTDVQPLTAIISNSDFRAQAGMDNSTFLFATTDNNNFISCFLVAVCLVASKCFLKIILS